MIIVLSACNKKEAAEHTPAPSATAAPATPAPSPTEAPPSSESAVSTESSNNNPLKDTYWRSVGITVDETVTDEFWADLFLWGDGTGYFRFSQNFLDEGFWGMREIFGCGWDYDGGALTIIGDDQTPEADLFTRRGKLEGDRLTLIYEGYYFDEIKIEFEKAEMPVYGSHWELPELYGSWRMVSHTGEGSESAASGISIHPASGAYFWLNRLIFPSLV